MQPIDILFIGNSYTNRNDLPGTITELARSSEPPRLLRSRRVIANGMSLKTHWRRGEARQAIKEGRWDYVVLQEQSTLPLKNRAQMHEYVRLFDQEIRQHGARTALYLTWARQNAPERQDELSDAYLSIGRELGTLVVPVGIPWQRVQAENPAIALHEKDMSHPTAAGSYLAACVFFAALLGKSPVGLPSTALQQAGISAASVKSMQQAAWQACQSLC